MGCLDLTIATLLIGILLIIKGSALFFFIKDPFAIYTIVFGLMCCVVMAIPHNLGLRTTLFVMFVIEIVLSCFVILLIIINYTELDKKFDCSSDSSTKMCENMKLSFYVALGIYVTLLLTLEVMVGVIIINGKRQQVEYHDKA